MDKERELTHKLNVDYYIHDNGENVLLTRPENMTAEKLTEIVMDIYDRPEVYERVSVEEQIVVLNDTEAHDEEEANIITFTPEDNPYLVALQKIPDD